MINSAVDFPHKHKYQVEHFSEYSTLSNSNETIKLSLMENVSLKQFHRFKTISYISGDKSLNHPKTSSYNFKNESLGSLSSEISLNIFVAIDKSKYILSLKDNWDDEGGLKYNEQTWIASIKFLLNYAKTLYEDFNTEVDTPAIYHGPKGSIDIMWEKLTYRMVINIQADGRHAHFYADNYKDQMTEGNFKLNQFNRFLIPLAIRL